ncbi:MAG: beta-lactamase family protein [Acidobacteria bacterium]|nr:beta-lactamase family protein [Acidobacteriota bacterium]
MTSRRRNAVALCIVFWFVLPVRAQQPGHSARFDQIAQHYYDSGQFMGNVLVAQGDQVVFEKSYGYANEEWKLPNTADSKFRLGSITKQFTAACILLLEERGKLKVDDPVKKYVPDAPPAWDKITIFQVLTHTSGIPSFTEFKDYMDWQLTANPPEKLIARFRDKPLDFEPGTKWQYSNSGYALLGYVVEKASGVTYQQFLQDNIFAPLHMADSGYDSNSAIIPHRAAGYTREKETLVNAGYVDMSVPYSAGALYSTTHDLLRWEQGLFGGRLLSAASLKKMLTSVTEAGNPAVTAKSDYGLGLFIRKVNGRTQISHGGGIQGFNTQLAYWPDEKLTIVVLSNVNGAAPGQISQEIAREIHGEPPPASGSPPK